MKYIRKGDRTSNNSYICSNCGIDFVADPPPTDKSGEIQVDAFPPPLILVPVELSLGFGEIGLLIVLLLALLDVFLDLFLEEAELRLPLDAPSTVVTPERKVQICQQHLLSRFLENQACVYQNSVYGYLKLI